MRGRSTLGATFFTSISSYAEQLDAVGGRLYIAGIDPVPMAQAERTGTVTADGPARLYGATDIIGGASLDAQIWVETQRRQQPEA